MDLLNTETYYYELPKRLIAQTPAEKRDMSRLLVIDKKTGKTEHRVFSDIVEYLKAGDCLVINDTRVIPARLYGKRSDKLSTAADNEIETVLLSQEGECWKCLTRPGKKTRPGTKIYYSDELCGVVMDVIEDGLRLIKFEYVGNFYEILDRTGIMPLPPYITEKLSDRERYQTVYALHNGSAAAPTAGLHFTNELLQKVRDNGVDIARVLLHVGLGTFRPVKEKVITDHLMHKEYIKVTDEAAEKINRARQNGGRVICVGTTSCRTLESVADENGNVKPFEGETGIFIYPGYKFKAMDGLITNFHLPESTLLMLVCAFGGYEHIMNAYKEAVEREYRFFSFGDCSFIQ